MERKWEKHEVGSVKRMVIGSGRKELEGDKVAVESGRRIK